MRSPNPRLVEVPSRRRLLVAALSCSFEGLSGDGEAEVLWREGQVPTPRSLPDRPMMSSRIIRHVSKYRLEDGARRGRTTPSARLPSTMTLPWQSGGPPGVLPKGRLEEAVNGQGPCVWRLVGRVCPA